MCYKLASSGRGKAPPSLRCCHCVEEHELGAKEENELERRGTSHVIGILDGIVYIRFRDIESCYLQKAAESQGAHVTTKE